MSSQGLDHLNPMEKVVVQRVRPSGSLINRILRFFYTKEWFGIDGWEVGIVDPVSLPGMTWDKVPNGFLGHLLPIASTMVILIHRHRWGRKTMRHEIMALIESTCGVKCKVIHAPRGHYVVQALRDGEESNVPAAFMIPIGVNPYPNRVGPG